MALTINNSRGELVRDPYKQKERYEKNRKKIDNVNQEDKKIILQILRDMELGQNVSVVKGSRSYTRLNTIKSRLKKISVLLETHYGKTLLNPTEAELADLFKKMREGIIKKTNGERFKAVADYVKVYKSFWHWHQKVSRKSKGKNILDITIDLDTRREKPKFVYFTFEEMKKMAEQSKYDYKVIMWFLFDTGMRAPTEMLNIKVKDFNQEKNELEIRDETSKTFGRKIKLILCPDLLKRYIKDKELKADDFIFNLNPYTINKYLKRIGERALNKKDLTMYDFRHSSACYWLPRYHNEMAMKYRFGWKESNMIHYYTEFLGMKDTITENDIIIPEDLNKLEKELSDQKRVNDLLQEQIKSLEEQRKTELAQLKADMPRMIAQILRESNKDKELIKAAIEMKKKR